MIKTYRSIIVDDEVKLQKVLQAKLEEYCPNIEVLGTANNIENAYELIAKHQPEIVFLDIHMPTGSGFDLLKRFPTINFEIIFVTGFNDYIIDALRVSAVDYLLKPVATKKLIEAVERAKIKIENKVQSRMYQNLVHNTNHIGDQATKVAISCIDSYEFIPINDIVRCEGWGSYTRIYLNNNSYITSSYNIGVFKEMFIAYGFYIPHKSHLINTSHILRYMKEGIVVMNDNSEVPVSRRKRDEFTMQILNNLLIKR